MVQPIKPRADTEGCACLRCRRVQQAVIRRSFGDYAHWSGRLLLAYPSISLFALALVALELGQRWLGATPTLQIELFGVSPIVLVPFFAFRGYVATVTVGELRGTRLPFRDALGHTLRRLPALAGAVLGTLIIAVLAMTAATVVAILAFWVGFGLGVVPGVDVVDALFDGPSGSLVFGTVVTVAAFKCWLAPEICVAGGYGPISALWLSWSLTATHRRWLLFVVVGFAVTLLTPHALAPVGAHVDAGFLLETPVLDAIGAFTRSLLYAVWFAIGTQIYVGAVVVR